MTPSPGLIKKAIFPILIIFATVSCYENDSTPERVGSTLDSRITGSVVLYDDLSNKVSPEGMTITIEGKNLTAISDSNGRFMFKDVSYGTYNFIYTKAGYGTFRLDTFRHVDDNDQNPSILPSRTLGAVSTTAITNFFISYTDSTLTLNPTIDPPGSAGASRGVRFFFGHTADVNGENYQGYTEVYGIKKESGFVKIEKATLLSMGFTEGATVFVRAYGDAFLPNDYINMTTGKRVFPNLNTSTIDAQSFVLQ